MERDGWVTDGLWGRLGSSSPLVPSQGSFGLYKWIN